MKKYKLYIVFLISCISLITFLQYIPFNKTSSFSDLSAALINSEVNSVNGNYDSIKTNISSSCFDQADHKVQFIEVEKDVKLEVLDWGGKGEYLVLLTGLGDNAHVFDNFAYQFTDLYHVIGITRRGFGNSDKPATGYSEERRVLDYLNVLDSLGIQSALFAGHSIAGGELSQLGIYHKDRVKKLVYIDASPDFGQHKYLDQPPSVDYSEEDLMSIERFIAATTRKFGYREPNSAVCNGYIIGNTGEIVDFRSPPEVSSQIIQSAEDKDFTKIDIPVLALFDEFTLDYRFPFYWYLDYKKQEEYLQAWKPLVKWQQDLINRFRTDVKNIDIIMLKNAYHYIFINKESDVAREMRRFLMQQ